MSTTRWLRRAQMRRRYGDISNMTLLRMVKGGRLPPPQFPFQNSVPAWNESELDEHDKAVVAGRAGKRAQPPGEVPDDAADPVRGVGSHTAVSLPGAGQ